MAENICKSYIPKSTQRTPETIQKQKKSLKRHFSKETIPVRNHSRYSSLRNCKATTVDTTAYLTGNCYQNKTGTPNHKIASVGWQEFGEIRSLCVPRIGTQNKCNHFGQQRVAPEEIKNRIIRSGIKVASTFNPSTQDLREPI